MGDTERLAALLHECAVGIRPCENPWPCQYMSVHIRDAARLLTAGVTLAPTPPDALREARDQIAALPLSTAYIHRRDTLAILDAALATEEKP